MSTKNMRRFALFCAAIAMVVCALMPAAHAETKARSAIREARERGELRWGIDAQGAAPYTFQDPMDPNHLTGFETEIATALGKKLGVKVKPVQGAWERLLDLLARGDFDIVLNGVEIVEEKKRMIDFSRPYYVATERLTVRKGDASAPRTLEQLSGRKVGSLPSTLAALIGERAGAEVKTYEGGQDDIYNDLRLRRTDAVLLDDPATLYYGAIDPDLEVVPEPVGEVMYGIALPKDDTETREAIDKALDELAKDGTLGAIYSRWGLWNEPTAKLLGVRSPTATSPEAYDAWRAAVGKPLPFWSRVRERYPATLLLFFRGAMLSLVVSLLAMGLAIFIGINLALGRVYGPKPLQWFAVGYIEIFRGTPLLVQLTMVYFGLPELGLTLSPFVAGVIALGLNYAAAEAENYRAGLSSVPAGQLDAAKTLGLTRFQALRYVALPQAFRIALPPATNDFIALLKDSSLISVVTLTELTKTYSSLASSMRDHLGLGLLVAMFYLGLSLPFARLSRVVEKRLGSHTRRAA